MVSTCIYTHMCLYVHTHMNMHIHTYISHNIIYSMYILPGYKESVRLLVKVAISSVCGRC